MFGDTGEEEEDRSGSTETALRTSFAANYTGTYNLVSIYDRSASQEINIPTGTFTLTVQPAGRLADPANSLDPYDLRMRIGNILGTGINVTHSNTIDQIVDMASIFSTRMLPPPEIFDVEIAIKYILPACTEIRFVVDD